MIWHFYTVVLKDLFSIQLYDSNASTFSSSAAELLVTMLKYTRYMNPISCLILRCSVKSRLHLGTPPHVYSHYKSINKSRVDECSPTPHDYGNIRNKFSDDQVNWWAGTSLKKSHMANVFASDASRYRYQIPALVSASNSIGEYRYQYNSGA